MTALQFSAEVHGTDIRCQITSDTDLTAPVFCFSLMVTPTARSGGRLLRVDGSYAEVQLPDLIAGVTHEVVVAYANPEYRPVNRAWLPLGAYLRVGSETLELPALPSGVQPAHAPPVEAPPDGLCLLPQPERWEPTGGEIQAAAFASDCSLLGPANALAQRCGLPPFLDPGGVPLTLTFGADLPKDGYEMTLGPNGIQARYGGAPGAHYAAISLLMLRATHKGALPCGQILDRPRFGWRGQHLDCARHFYQTGTLHRLLDLMALCKLNRFHWHFSDDEAFRLDLDSVPEVSRTFWRGEGELVPGVFGGGPRAGGSYSRAEAQALIAHGQELFIEILPEIEFPAHALALARAVPQTRDPGDTGTEASVQGYLGNVLNPAMPATWDLMTRIADEVSALFPLGLLHLGADELPPETWAGSPAIDALKAREGLETRDDVMGWALHRLAGHLDQRGIRSAAWEEAAKGAQGGIGHGALLFSWTGQQAGIDAARAGYDVVMSPAQHVYLDMAHTSAPEDWGAAWAAFVSLRDSIDWTVIPHPDIADRIAGVEGTFWGEFTTEDRQIEPMLAPRILGVASKAWEQADPIDPQLFLPKARAVCEIFSAMGWTWNAACFAEPG